MRKTLVAMSAVLVLAACNQKTDDDVAAVTTPAATDTMAMGTPAATAQAGTGSMAGTYEMRAADGKLTTQTVNTDGTYRSVSDGRETTGTWRMQGTQACYDPAGAPAEQCWTTTAPTADGSFTASAPDGTTMTVRKTAASGMAGTAAPAM